MSDIFYKIRKKGTDLYSSGGSSPRWVKVGKTWNTLGHLKSHLAMVEKQMSYRSRWWKPDSASADYQDAEVATFEAQVIKTEDPVAIMQSAKDKAAEKQRKQEDAQKRADEEREKRELRRLQAKYPGA